MKKKLKLERDSQKHFISIKEEKKLKKLSTVIMIAILIFGVLISLDVLLTSKIGFGPFLAIRTKVYKDGSKEYYGFGYKVIKYRQEKGRRDTILGDWMLKYNVNPKNITLEDLSFSLRNNSKGSYKKLYQSYLALTGKVYRIDSTNKVITLRYEDENGDSYTINAECKMLDENFKNIEEGDVVTILGSIYEYTPRKNRNPRKIVLRYGFIK